MIPGPTKTHGIGQSFLTSLSWDAYKVSVEPFNQSSKGLHYRIVVLYSLVHRWWHRVVFDVMLINAI